MCANGFVGLPTDGSQCYRQQGLNEINDTTLPFGHASLIAVGRNILVSNSDITLIFAVISGTIDVYISTNNRAVRLVEAGSQLNSLRVIIQEGVDVIFRERRDLTASYILEGKQDLQSDTVPSAPNGPVYRYQVDERLTIVIPHDQPHFEESFHYITVHSREQSRFQFDYRQTTPRLNLYFFLGLFFSCLVLMSILIVSSWNLVHSIKEWRLATLERRRRERLQNKPLYSVIAYLHDGMGTGKGGEGVAVSDAGDIADNADRAYQEIDAKLSSKTVLILDGRPTYITKKKPKKPRVVGGAVIRRRKGKSVTMDPSDLGVWPVTMQPTEDERASVHSLIVQLPCGGKSLRHVVCVGSTLVTFATPETGGKSMPPNTESETVELEVMEGAAESQSQEVELEVINSEGTFAQSGEVELATTNFSGQVGIDPGVESAVEIDSQSRRVEPQLNKVEIDSKKVVETQSTQERNGVGDASVSVNAARTREGDSLDDWIRDNIVLDFEPQIEDSSSIKESEL
jgi:hypothetical protein